MTEEEKPIRVVDRRMFTPEGELRPDFEAEEREEARKPPTPPPPPAAAAPAAPPEPGQARPDAEPAAPPASSVEPTASASSASSSAPTVGEEGGLLDIVRSLGTTAYAALGLVPDPSGARRRDPTVARQMIEWLSVLEQKTRGNLTFEESDMLTRVLYELRMAYVEVMRPAGGQPKR